MFFHNLSKYDSRQLIRYLSLLPDKKLTVVPCTDKKYNSFSLHVSVGNFVHKKGKKSINFEEIRFLDSLRFLPDSLNNLSKSLHWDDSIIMKHFKPEDKKKKLLMREVIYPYSYIDLHKKFDEKTLPKFGSDWMNVLSGQFDVLEADVQLAQKIWEKFGCKTIGVYHNLF